MIPPRTARRSGVPNRQSPASEWVAAVALAFVFALTVAFVLVGLAVVIELVGK